MIFSGESVRKISIKTGTTADAQSNCDAELKICDNEEICCKTSNLDNPGDDRERGKTDDYTDPALLGHCGKMVRKSFKCLKKKSVFLSPGKRDG